jgi:hypothetical protein
MSEGVEKTVTISFIAKNLVKETVDEIQINMRGLAFQFQAAAYSLGELNKLMFGSSEIGKQFTSVLHGIGVALRLVTVSQQLATVASAVLGVNIASLTQKYIGLIAATVAYMAKTAAATIIEWAHVIALKARAIAAAVAMALESWGLGLLAIAGITAAAVAIVTSAIPSKQFGGDIERTGVYMLHRGERVVTSGSSQPSIVIHNLTVVADNPQQLVSKLRSAGAI